MVNKINVLGTNYTIKKKKYSEEEAFDRNGIDGYCDGMTKLIVYCDMDTYKGWEHESDENKRANERHTLRHEIVHAFFNESGLMASSHRFDGAFSTDEELVDWIAIQGEKIYLAWEKVGCLEKQAREQAHI